MTSELPDPRSIITPEAFEIDRRLLGTPLATPSRRLAAMLIDVVIVGLLTALLSDAQLLLWGVIALVLVRVAFKRTGRSMSQTAGVLLRTSAGCLGVAILSIVLIAWGFSRMGGEEREAAINEVIERGTQLVGPELRSQIGRQSYDGADTPEEALRVMERAARELRDLPVSVRRQLLRASVPPEAAWAEQTDSLVQLAIELTDPSVAPAPVDSASAAVAADLTDAEALRALAAAVDSPAAGVARLRALRARTAEIVAGDTIRTLAGQVEDLRSDLASEQEARRELETEIEEARTGLGAFTSVIGDVWKQLGSGLGLWSLYFTTLLTLWGGQTIGKRIMGVRVLRLDGEPIRWWSAFERAGGYAAGVATGLLGFAQILWDRNRQCIHDKIVGTVVVVEGAERVPGDWDQAWLARTRS